MKLLFLAPEPFFQERGTPIAARLALEVLAKRSASASERIDFLTYNEGADVPLSGINHMRIFSPRALHGVGPGVSFKKLVCDAFFAFAVLKLVWTHRKDQYDLIHAIEESAFIAWLIKLLFGIPYIYDMDSSLSMQLVEKWPLLRPLAPLFSLMERSVVRNSVAVVPVCDALAVIADRHGSRFTSILRDISLLNTSQHAQDTGLRSEISADSDRPLALYIGNLEPYQGIDLLLESFSLVCREDASALLVIIGGREEHIAMYRLKAEKLQIDKRVFLIGPRPVSSLDRYIFAADILLSPRVRGNNTPMKIYSYLHSGRAILATDLPTHTQVLDDKVAELCAPEPEAFARGFLRLIRNPARRHELGLNASALARQRYTFEVFSTQLNEIYDKVSSTLRPGL